MKFLPIILIAILAFIVGVSIKTTLISPFNAVSESQNEASDSAEMSQENRNLNELSGESITANKTFTKHGNTYTSQTLDDKIVMNGVYRLSTYNVNFTITLPKNGGAISGNLSGTCEAAITGNADQPDSNGNSNISGQYSGNCKPIPTLGYKTPALGTFTGVIRFKENKAEISVKNKEPIETGSWFEMHF
jgi:hypothetical protein